MEFFNLIDRVMKLSPEQEQLFHQELARFEKEMEMPYVSSIERIGIQKGLEKGLEKGREEERLHSLEIVLRARFGESSVARDRLKKLSADQLEVLLSLAATAPSLEEFAAQLNGDFATEA